ncbi:MAG TPA: MBL fold metallo-hydrolase, partial [Nitrospiraceae bacterium]|nr:MBL fold metallo-hydrolase [Nitrospiraceae bacterium]
MKILFLGSGTSTGVPVIGCKCSICSSDNPKNRRTRASILISNNSRNILIDTATDLRFQALTYSIERIDAVFFTHAHADHIHGIDELRSFNHLQGGPIPCYGSSETLEAIRYKFGYV